MEERKKEKKYNFEKRVHSKEKKREAETMYIVDFAKPSEIAKNLKVPYDTLQSWIKDGKWRLKRDLAADESQREIAELKKAQLSNISVNIIDIIDRSVSEIARTGNSLEIRELLSFSNFAANMEKILRLSHGLATEIKEDRTANVQINYQDNEKVRKLLEQLDPFNVKEKDIINVTPEAETEKQDD